MAKSSGTRTGVVGRLRDKIDRRRERRAEKARISGEAKREWDRGGKSDRRAGATGSGASGI